MLLIDNIYRLLCLIVVKGKCLLYIILFFLFDHLKFSQILKTSLLAVGLLMWHAWPYTLGGHGLANQLVGNVKVS